MLEDKESIYKFYENKPSEQPHGLLLGDFFIHLKIDRVFLWVSVIAELNEAVEDM